MLVVVQTAHIFLKKHSAIIVVVRGFYGDIPFITCNIQRMYLE